MDINKICAIDSKFSTVDNLLRYTLDVLINVFFTTDFIIPHLISSNLIG